MEMIDLKKIVEELVGLEKITVSQDIDIVNDHYKEWIEDRSKPEVVLPQLFRTEIFFRSHDQMGHQGMIRYIKGF